MIIEKILKIDIIVQIATVDVNSSQLKSKLRVSPKPALRPPAGHLVVSMYFIGLYLICPDLAWFENLVLDVKIVTGNSRG